MYVDMPYPTYGFAQSRDAAELHLAAARMRYPLVVKPADATGSKGVEAVGGELELAAAIERARAFSFGGEVIVEEMVAGQHLGCECFLRDGEPVLVVASERGHTGMPYFLTTSHVMPARLPPATARRLTEMIRAICAAVGHHDGPLNLDLVLGDDGTIYPIEMGARLGGNGLPDLVRLARGVDVVEAAIRLALGRPFDLTPRRRRVAASAVLYTERPGVLAGLEGCEAVLAQPTTERLELFANPGESVRAFTTNANKLGILVAAADSYEQVEIAVGATRRTLRFDIREPSDSGAVV